jgi:GR25 family glycosyltransferase involved in LPS biosynthesis
VVRFQEMLLVFAIRILNSLCVGRQQLADCYFCICLVDRNDRLHESSDEFHNYGLCRLVQYVRVQKPDEQHCQDKQIQSRGRYGCWESHALVAKLAAAQQSKRCGVFEDDLIIIQANMNLVRLQELVHRVQEHMPSQWDVLKLGQITQSGDPYVEICKHGYHQQMLPMLYRADSTQTHAMIWSERGFSKQTQRLSALFATVELKTMSLF